MGFGSAGPALLDRFCRTGSAGAALLPHHVVKGRGVDDQLQEDPGQFLEVPQELLHLTGYFSDLRLQLHQHRGLAEDSAQHRLSDALQAGQRGEQELSEQLQNQTQTNLHRGHEGENVVPGPGGDPLRVLSEPPRAQLDVWRSSRCSLSPRCPLVARYGMTAVG